MQNDRPGNNWDRVAAFMQNTAVIQERIMARLDNLDEWRKGVEDERRRAEDRKEDRIEKQPENQRANIAIMVSVGMFLFYLFTYVSAHWKP